jgi:hypothetical protein
MIVLGIILIVFGLLLCLTIIGAPIGFFLIFMGFICLAIGAVSRRRTVITNVVQVSNVPGHQHAQIPLDDVETTAPRMRTIEPPMYAAPVLESPRSDRKPAPIIEQIDFAEQTSPRDNGYAYDRRKWNALVEYDEDIGRVANALGPYGEKYVDQFAAAYLALNDKQYLPVIVKKIIATAQEERARA